MLNLALTWIGIGADYLIALALIAGGVYLVLFVQVKPLRFIGAFLIMLGGDIAVYAYGKSTGAADCMAEWKAKNYEAQIDRLKQEADVKKIAADASAQETQQLASQNDDLQKQVVEYQGAASKLPVCRRATADDDKRVCNITGQSAVGCEPAR